MRMEGIEGWAVLSLLLVVRYLLFAGLPYLFFYQWKPAWLPYKKIQHEVPGRSQVLRELRFSLLTLLIYSAGIGIFLMSHNAGEGLNYSDWQERGALYALWNFIVMILIHDTYYYWTHRLMHLRQFFPFFHSTHHQFRNPTPLSAFAFHPLEAILSIGIIPIVLSVMPWHQNTLIAFVTVMSLYDVFIHLGHEFPGIAKSGIWITPLQHDAHHRDSRVNYGLYFTFWDRLMKTGKYCRTREFIAQKYPKA